MFKEKFLKTNSHETHAKSDIWMELIKLGIEPTKKDENGKMYTRYGLNELDELLQKKKSEQQEKAA